MDRTRADQILEIIRAVWQVDEPFLAPMEDGFHWWPGHHKVTVRCQAHTDAAQTDTWLVVVTTEVLKGLDFTDPAVTRLLASMAGMSPTYSWVYTPPAVAQEYGLPLDGKLCFQSSVYVRPELAQWLPRFLAQTAIMQPIDAERLAPAEAFKHLGAEADVSGPRLTAQDEAIDEMLHVVEGVYLPLGQDGSQWASSKEFEEFAARFGQSDMCFGNGDPTGLTLEVPFGANSTLIRQHTDIVHPALGAGLLSTIQLPVFQDLEACIDTCMWLNFFGARHWTDVPVLGSWHPKQIREDQYTPAYGAFLPNALYSPGLASNMALWCMGLARWARATVWPQLEDQTMHEILLARLEAQSSENRSS